MVHTAALLRRLRIRAGSEQLVRQLLGNRVLGSLALLFDRFRVARVAAGGLALALLALSLSCQAPVLSQDGQLVFSEGGQRGASVLTANGVQFIDRSARPTPKLRTSAYEAWEPPTGFLLPASGVLTQRSRPVSVPGRGVGFVLRASDAYAPTWGGEVLLRIDVEVPVEAFPELRSQLRVPAELVLIVDFSNRSGLELVYTALEQLGGRDRVSVLDARRNQRLVPPLPGTHRALIAGAIEQNLNVEYAGPGELEAALEVARAHLAPTRGQPIGERPVRRLLLLSDGIGFATARGLPVRKLEQIEGQLGSANLLVMATTQRAALPPQFAHTSGDLESREQALRVWLPPPGPVVIRDLEIAVDGAPAPTRILEASGADVEWGLERDSVPLGDFNLGESRTEMLRVSVPHWVDGQPLALKFSARYRAQDQASYSRSRATLGLRYTNDIEILADRRHGDVIAYASALAMVRRLERVFQGRDVERLGGLESVVLWQAKGLDLLAKSSRDASLAEQAELLRILLEATR